MQPFQPLRQVFTREELTFIADLCKKYDAYCITDEVYEHIVYAPTSTSIWHAARHVRANHQLQLAVQNVLHHRLASGLHHRPGADHRAHQEGPRLPHRGAAAPLQEAVVTALNFDDSYYQEVLDLYTAKRDLFCQGLDSIGLEHNVPQGAYYVMMDISEFGYDSDLEFCEDLASKVGVGAVPGSSFFREPVNHLIRFHFAKRDETLNAALENLKSLRDKIKPRG